MSNSGQSGECFVELDYGYEPSPGVNFSASDGFSDGVVGVDGEDVAMEEDKVCLLAQLGRLGQKREREGEEEE